jgi:hypothetical protein
MKININFYHISLASSSNEKCFSCRENQNTHYAFSDLFFLENLALCEIM